MSELHNPWRQFIENCISGDNYFRASEYRRLLDQIDGWISETATLRAQVAHQAEEIVRYKMAGENLCAAALIVGESADKDIAKLTAEIEWMRNQTTSGVEKIRALTLLSRQSAVNAAAELAQLTAERDALRARVAELEADLKPKAGRCELGDALCNCGGDVPAIRYGCANWRCV